MSKDHEARAPVELLSVGASALCQVCATDALAQNEDIATPRRDSDLTAWVNIIAGCNEKCSFCVVPYTR